jgi:hypothetical protein
VSLKDRLHSASLPDQDSGCRVWQRAVNISGYGVLWFDGKPGTAHRAAWIAEHGAIPDGQHVLHRCDNRRCIEPTHLFLGSNADNVADKVAKGRQFRPDYVGSKNNMAKLDEEKVRVIRRLAKQGLSNRRIAESFAVSIMTISMIRNHRTWTHVTEEMQ